MSVTRTKIKALVGPVMTAPASVISGRAPSLLAVVYAMSTLIESISRSLPSSEPSPFGRNWPATRLNDDPNDDSSTVTGIAGQKMFGKFGIGSYCELLITG